MARVSAALWRRAWLRATLTLTPPLAWFLVIYLASLALMLVTAFWTVNPFTNVLEHSWTLTNFNQLFTSTYPTIIARTVEMAAIVTVTDAMIALPFAYYMARVASPRMRRLLFSAVLLPLWASYLARVYAWIVILQKGGTLSWTSQQLGPGRDQHRLHEHGDVARVLLHLAAVHDRAALRGARADPRLAARGLRRSRRARLAHAAHA